MRKSKYNSFDELPLMLTVEDVSHLFSVRLVQRKYPVLFGTWVAFSAYPQ